MKLEILDHKVIEHRTWYLCKGNLHDYLKSLKPDFYDYAIQRKIVRNQYLDMLYTTIKAGDPIPTITLTYPKAKLDNVKAGHGEIDLLQTEILDGLQRSFRLWAYLIMAEEFKAAGNPDYRDFARLLKEKNRLFFDSGVLSTKVIKKLIEEDEVDKIQSVFQDFEVYFTIWSGLGEKEIIRKMLVLNAGQKSVSKTHQFELLFLHFYEDVVRQNKHVALFREKDERANDVKTGKRSPGEFMFPSLIVALQSMVVGKPLRVSTEKLIEHEFEDDQETPENTYDLVFNKDFLKYFLEKVRLLDDKIYDAEKALGREWFSKDTTLNGVFAAVGSKISFLELTEEGQLEKQLDEVIETLVNEIGKGSLKLEQFTEEYNKFSSRSVNIGVYIRKVVMEFTLDLLTNSESSWKSAFSRALESKRS